MLATASTPAEVDLLFAERINAGDLEGVLALYEAGATFVPPGESAITGVAAIRERIAAIIASEFEISVTTTAVHESGDTAAVYNDWTSFRRGPCGERLASAGKALEVVRRQADGSWLCLIDDPFGRG
jgi:uncharacterized protein (TIGR02246 family)